MELGSISRFPAPAGSHIYAFAHLYGLVHLCGLAYLNGFAHPSRLAHPRRFMRVLRACISLWNRAPPTDLYVSTRSRIFSRPFWQLFSVFDEPLCPSNIIRYTILQICVSDCHFTRHSFANVRYELRTNRRKPKIIAKIGPISCAMLLSALEPFPKESFS